MHLVMDKPLIDRIKAAIRDIPDFPEPGILFKDITPILSDGPLFHAVIDQLAAQYSGQGIEAVVGIESRGFMFGAPLALALGCGFIPIRKPGKLPYRKIRVDYALEYGTDSLEVHEDAIRPGQRVLLIDDLLATGGTAAAALRLIEQLQGVVAAAAFVVELGFLEGRSKLTGVPVSSLVQY